MRCPECGDENDPSDAVCRQCGTSIQEADVLQGARATEDTDLADLADLTAELREALQPKLQIVKALGQGGMGTVYLARDPALKRSVVVKVLSPALEHDATARRRFEREAESAAAVSHPNVVSVFQVGELPRSGTSYFVMQHVDGPTLADAVPPGTIMNEARAKRIIGEVASALAAAHTRGLVHRDIKPSNIMLEAHTDRAIVLDFGISAAVHPERRAQDTRLTVQGSSIGTPQYMSPEQAAGEDVSDKSDVYSLGLVAFELLTGSPPFEESTPMALVAAHINKEPPGIASRRPDVDPILANLVGQCLRKDPADRPSATELTASLLPGKGQVVEWPPPGLEHLRQDARAFADAVRRLALWSFFTMAVLAYLAGSDSLILLGVVAAMLAWSILRIVASGLLLVQSVSHAARQRYGARAIVEVALDSSDGRGALLNGVGPFGTVSSEERARLVRYRNWSSVYQLAAVVWLAVAPAAWFGVSLIRGAGETTAIYTVPQIVGAVLAAGALWLVGTLLGLREHRITRRRLHAFTLSRNLPPLREDIVLAWSGAAGRSAGRPGRHVLASAMFGFGIAIPLLSVIVTLYFAAAVLLVHDVYPAVGDVTAPSERELGELHAGVDSLTPWSEVSEALRNLWPAPTPDDAAGADAALAALTSEANLEYPYQMLAGHWDRQVERAFEVILREEWLDSADRDALESIVNSAVATPQVESLRHLAGFSDVGALGQWPPMRRNGRVVRWFANVAHAEAALAIADGDVNRAVRRLREVVAARHVELAIGACMGCVLYVTSAVRLLRDVELRRHPADRTQDAARVLADLERLNGVLFYEPEAFGELPPMDMQRSHFWLSDMWWVASSSNPPAQALAASPGLPALLRARLIVTMVEGLCSRTREVLFGMAPSRRRSIAEAGRGISDIPWAGDVITDVERRLRRLDAGFPPRALTARINYCF